MHAWTLAHQRCQASRITLCRRLKKPWSATKFASCVGLVVGSLRALGKLRPRKPFVPSRTHTHEHDRDWQCRGGGLLVWQTALRRMRGGVNQRSFQLTSTQVFHRLRMHMLDNAAPPPGCYSEVSYIMYN